MALSNQLSRYAPVALSLLRIVAALVFLEHGTQKLLGFPISAPNGVPAMLTLPWVAGVIEIVTGVLMTIGLFTRAAAFVASGEMAVAYFMAHAPRGLYPIQNMGDAAILYCFVFLFLVFAGAGVVSVDAAMKRNSAY